jgi:O-antigen/teichoic acid export membrane protein
LIIAVAYAISALLIFFSQLILFKKTVCKNNFDATDNSTEDWAGRIISFSLPFSLFGMFTWAQQASDRWGLAYFSSIDVVGQYAVLFQLGFTPSMLCIGLIMQFLAPILYIISGSANDPDRNQRTKRVALSAVLVSLLGTLVLASIALNFHAQIFKLLTASRYWGVSDYLPWMVLAGGLFGAGELFALKAMSEIKITTITKVKIATSLFAISFNIVGAYFFGLSGVVAAVLSFGALYFACMFMTTR